MNLIDAIESGRPFRRPGRNWTIKCPDRDGIAFADGSDSPPRLFYPSDVCADDWEIQEPTVTITRAQFWDAVNGCAKLDAKWHASGKLASSGLHNEIATIDLGPVVRPAELARKLGLEPE